MGYLGQAQVGIGTSLPDPSSALDISANNKGLLIPRLTTVERNAIASAANGLLIFNTDSDEFQYNSSNSTVPIWRALSLTGTSIASPGDSVKYSNTDVTTDVNPNTAITVPIFGNLLWNDNTTLYVVAGNQVTITEAGRYEFIINISLINVAAGARNAPEMRLSVNGTEIGSYGATGYMRSQNGHDESSLHLREVLELNANDVVSIGIQRAANGGVVNLRSAGSSTVYIEKKL
ncbi:hypothetical protein GCM10008083_11730 [Ulvibacter litoralis]|nr:hypothetical protein GCM10008083_11730 [Ulvibacter litoralis]